MCVSIVIWYIVDGKTAGVLVFFFIFSFFEMIILLKFPRLVIIAIISIVTQTLIVGYERKYIIRLARIFCNKSLVLSMINAFSA